ncbi:DUF5677 domain-containing protein [Salinimicrobium soli]|uniref:DUF5677 domain-containing protein n=1 Tax=Salinimicrobium soli TaxID=1254399 RepID=UPI003AAEB104
MNTKQIEEILPSQVDENLQSILDSLSQNLNEVVSYGTHILKWDVETKRQGKDNHIPALFFRNVIELGDSIALLVKNSSIDPSKILLRTLIENSYGLFYMLEKNEKQRALSYMVWKAINDIKLNKRFISDNASSKELKSKIQAFNPDFDSTKFFDKEETRKLIETKSRMLGSSEFKEIYQEYLRTKNLGGKNKNPNWYSLFNGPTDFQQLSNYLKKSLEYEFYYRKYSANVHTTDVAKGIARAGDGKGQIIQIRDFEHCTEVYSITISNLLMVYNQMVIKRIPGQEINFKEWYSKFRQIHFTTLEKAKFNYKKHN